MSLYQATIYCSTCLILLPVTSHAQTGASTFSGGVTIISQGVDDDRIDSLTTASADLFITMERTGGSWLVYLEANSSPAIDGVASQLIESNADAGSALDKDRRGRGQISELNYTFRQQRGELTAGLIDPSAYLDRSRITNDENVQFMGAGFVNNPTIEFPDYSLGIAYQRPASNGLPDFNLVVSSSHGLADNPNLSYPQLLSVNDNDKGMFAGAGVGFRSESRLLRVGAWINTAPHDNIIQTKSKLNNYGVYSVIGYTSGDHGVNLRLGLANDEVSQASSFASLAYRLRHGNNALGIGFSRSFLSAAADIGDRDDTSQFELFYRIALGENMHITPSLQYLENSSFDASGQIFDPRITVAGLRFHYAF